MEKIQAYKDALRSHEEAQQECEGFAETVRRVGTLMSNWPRVYLTNTSHGFPMELVLDFRIALMPINGQMRSNLRAR